ncbi:ATP synthase F1 subunit gamma [Marinilabiliaceae bacterium JC017]|nr:ATP synthase F1 subunit gamma [Marinilabiliaceae bacterium JC017]
MPSLKDIRTRINSVKTTRQVTSAMKMVSAAKFKKAQDDIFHIRPYVDKLTGIIYDLTNSLDEEVDFAFSEKRDPNRVLIFVVTSNRGLCGAFNSNVIKETEKLIRTKFFAQLKNDSLHIVAVGKQGQKVLKMHDYTVVGDFNDFYSHPSFEEASNMAEMVMDSFLRKEYDRVLMVYNEFINAAVHEVKTFQFLPLEIPFDEHFLHPVNYIFEPDKLTIINKVIPKALKTIFYRILLESLASEHGARMTSMHKATDNATHLLSELQLAYNKVRQGAITKEILEIVGGAEALKK